MNILNRVIAVLVALLLVVGGVIVLLAIFGVADAQTFGPPWIEDGLRRLTLPDMRATAIISALAATIIGFILLVLEFRPPRREPDGLAVKQDELGKVTVARRGIRDLVNREADQVDGVSQVYSQVTEDRNGLRILCRLTVDSRANVIELADEVRERVKTAVEQHLGQPVAQVAVQTQMAAANGSRRVR
jgi:uncharacterized alkaline shock family protein YloU